MEFAEIMLPHGRRRIAICFSGQLRTWRSCADSWHNILLHNGRDDNIDVFCHLWDYNTQPNAVDPSQTSVKIENEEIRELLEVLKPKNYLIEQQKEFKPYKPNQAITTPSFLSQFYGIMKVARLKKEYEIKNDLMYDVVVRARYDSLYLTRLSDMYNSVEPNIMHGFHIGWDYLTNRGRMGDICWMADSQTYDIIADYYINNGNIEKKWFTGFDGNSVTPEWVFFHYLKKNKIELKSYPWEIKLFRYSKDQSFSKDKNGFETW